MTDPIRERHIPKPHMTAVDEDGMCPNCCTPWKCNGPHVPEMRQAGEVCAWCGNRWPCDAIQAVVQRDAASADAAQLYRALRGYAYSPAVDGECEHGFWWEDCTNEACRLRDARAALRAHEEATK